LRDVRYLAGPRRTWQQRPGAGNIASWERSPTGAAWREGGDFLDFSEVAGFLSTTMLSRRGDSALIMEHAMSQKLSDLSQEMRKEIFRELVETQDQAIGVKQSRKLICERFGLTDDDVREIEREGLDAEWPPLS
jgi:hypothetical protein